MELLTKISKIGFSDSKRMSENLILTFKILFWHSNWVVKSYFDIQNPILSRKILFWHSKSFFDIALSQKIFIYTPGIYAEGYTVFVFLFVRTYVRSYVRSFIVPSRSWNYFKVLRASNSSGVYLTNHYSESIHIWTIGTLEGRLSFHDSSSQGPCPGVGLEVKI